MNFYVDPQQGHDGSLIGLALVIKAFTDFSPRAAKVALLDGSSHHLHIRTHLFSEKNTVSTIPPHLW
jgi:hypothetical protein